MLLKQSVIKTKRYALLFGKGRRKIAKTWTKINSGLNLEANFQLTIQLEKLEWTPGPWGNYLYLLTASVPSAWGDCSILSSINSPNPGQLHLWQFPVPTPPCSLLADRNFPGCSHQAGINNWSPLIRWNHIILCYQLKAWAHQPEGIKRTVSKGNIQILLPFHKEPWWLALHPLFKKLKTISNSQCSTATF